MVTARVVVVLTRDCGAVVVAIRVEANWSVAPRQGSRAGRVSGQQQGEVAAAAEMRFSMGFAQFISFQMPAWLA